jgi:hypothetical protein
MADPTSVPAEYAPNYALTWVKKCTYIWPLHPTDPRRQDKGGSRLTLVDGTGGTASSWTPSKTAGEYTLEFKGAGGRNYYSDSQFILGDSPILGGNQTPPAIFCTSFWVYMYAFGGTSKNTGFVGNNNSQNPWIGISNPSGQVSGYVQGVSTYTTALSLNTWYHITLFNSASFRRIYVNGVKVIEATNNSIAGDAEVFYISKAPHTVGPGTTAETLSGRMRLVAVCNGANWTDAEILEQYQRPFAYYGPARPTTGVVVLSELKTELTTDPMGYGYAGPLALGQMGELARLLNLARVDEMPMPRNTVTREQMNSSLWGGEYYALTPARQMLWNTYTRQDINMKLAPAMRTRIEELFLPEAYTVAQLQANAWLKIPSRAEVLWGVDAVVAWEQCQKALLL